MKMDGNLSRIRCEACKNKVMTAGEASMFVKDGMTIGTSGFTLSGYPKAIGKEIARRVDEGETIGLTVVASASTGEEFDGILAACGAIKKRYAFQSNQTLRNAINQGKIEFVDMHLSNVPYFIRNGLLGDIDVTIVEAVAITEEGHIVPSSSIGCSDVLVEAAGKVIVEINLSQPEALEGMHDIYKVEPYPGVKPIPIVKADDRVGVPYITCSSDKIAAIVITDIPDRTREVREVDEISRQIAEHLNVFLHKERGTGRFGGEFLLPIQSGVGKTSNAILKGLLHSDFENLEIYSEVLQDAVIDLIDAGKVIHASATSVSLSPDTKKRFYQNLQNYQDKIILRPQEISNSPEVIRRLGVIAINTPIEVDICGNVNSSYIRGRGLMNGIGGSSDFTRNALIPVFVMPSTAKGGLLSTIVPEVCHVDHTSHDLQILITEQGVADVRGMSPMERAKALIENCAHPRFREELLNQLDIKI
ncbi:MAG: acetyl-CoA hydrolase/transferase C-terminal domain-containing protein [Lachnospiraceae bacterium]